MITIALTGGVATGKSMVMEVLHSRWENDAAVFSSDASVHELLTTGPIKTRITKVFGEGVLDANGEIDRGELRKIVFRNESLRRRLEGILHPEVQARGEEFMKQAAKDRKLRLIFEIPLLYEVDSQLKRNYDVVVAASEEIQRHRLAHLRNLEHEMIDGLLAAQMPMKEKTDRADFVIWNDASTAELNEQVSLLADWIDQKSA